MVILKILILIFSSIGFYLYLKRKTKIQDEFLPVIIISSIGVLEYIAGILNILKLMAILIALTGLVMFVKEIFIIKKYKIKLQFNFSTIILNIIVLISIYWVKGIVLTVYDNFSHWKMIANEMLISNRFPNFKDPIIIFQSYPPGTACVIYYFCKYLGNSEPTMVFAQNLLIISSIYTIFVFCNKDKKINYVIAILTTIFLIVGNIFLNQLVVDTVLSVMGIAALAMIIYYKEDSKKALLTSIPVLALLIIVKNSGLFFVIIDILVWICFFIKNNGIKSVCKSKYAILVLLPIIVLMLWKTHISLVYDIATLTKHSMSIANYEYNFNQKGTETIKQIADAFEKKMISLDTKENIIMLILFSILVSLIIFSRKNKKMRVSFIIYLAFFIITYILYQICLFGTYVFSMPPVEAQSLSSYDRYFSTLVLFEYGVCSIAILKFFNNIDIVNKYKNCLIKIFILILLIIPITFYPENIKLLYSKPVTQVELARRRLIELTDMYNIEKQKSYLIYNSAYEDVSEGILYFMGKCDYRSMQVKVIKSFDELESIDEILDYEYFIILKRDKKSDEFIDAIKGDKNQNVFKFSN